jgi:uncharacterized protein DUF1702
MTITMLGAIRKRFIAPPLDEGLFPARGFPTDTPARGQLEESIRQALIGFEIAIEHQRIADIVARLESLEFQFRGLAYEGAAMALTVRDTLSPLPGNRNTESFMAGPGAHQLFMDYIGVGLALARLPRFLWRRALPNQGSLPDLPAFRWMIIDGYGFHQAYFHTEKWVARQHVSAPVPWDGPHDYVLRVIDQGVGRALWFVNAGDVGRLAAMIGGFPPGRRPDLWSGAGLAITYAGGVDEDDLVEFTKRSWEYHPEVAQGAAWAIKQRFLSNLVTEHTELAAQVICQLPAAEVSALTEDLPELPGDSSIPDYEVLRQHIQAHFRS